MLRPAPGALADPLGPGDRWPMRLAKLLELNDHAVFEAHAASWCRATRSSTWWRRWRPGRCSRRSARCGRQGRMPLRAQDAPRAVPAVTQDEQLQGDTMTHRRRRARRPPAHAAHPNQFALLRPAPLRAVLLDPVRRRRQRQPVQVRLHRDGDLPAAGRAGCRRRWRAW